MTHRQLKQSASPLRRASQAPLIEQPVTFVSFEQYVDLGGHLLRPQHEIVRNHVTTPHEENAYRMLFKADLDDMAKNLPITQQDIEVMTRMLVLLNQHPRLQYGKTNASTPIWLLMESHRLQGKDPDKLIDHMLGVSA